MSAPPPAPRLRSLTSLRFVAALLVVGHHVPAAVGRGELPAVEAVFGQGWVGVPFFFVLSGFVLTWSRRADDAAGRFYRRRLARIFPLHVVTWATAMVVRVAFGTRDRLLGIAASLLLVQVWFPDDGVYYAVNAPAWSLACELFFYALFPLLIGRLARLGPQARRRLAGSLFLVIVAIGIAFPAQHDGTFALWAAAVFPPARLPEFVLGILVALELRDGRLPRLRLAPCLLVAAVAYAAVPHAPGSLAVALVVIPFTAVIVAAAQHDLAGAVGPLGRRTMVRLGEWSFALYLVHFPVMQLAHEVVEVAGASLVTTVLVAAMAVAGSIAAAGVLYERVERPLERRLREPVTRTDRAPAPV